MTTKAIYTISQQTMAATSALAETYCSNFLNKPTLSQFYSVMNIMSNTIATNPPPSGNYNNSAWQNQIFTIVTSLLQQTYKTLAFFKSNPSSSTTSGLNTSSFDPLSQNFFVDSGRFPNGIFLSSIGLFFATVDQTNSVTIRIRPTVNGYPDAVNDIPGSIVTKNPIDINIPNPSVETNSIGPQTNFYFDHPIYLPPGQYSLMISSNSNNYTLYASKMGEVQYGTTSVISSPSYTGALFKSQNASTWVPAVGETLAFVINMCNFAGGTTTFDLKSRTSLNPFQYDLVNLATNDQTFNSVDSITYSIDTKNALTNSFSGYTNVLVNQNNQLPYRQVQQHAGDTIVSATVTNTDNYTSPVIDLQRLNSIFVKNILTPYNSANTVSESLGGFGNGGASARYITRRVTLNNNFNSTGLTVYVDVNRQPGTKIEVYYKVMSQYDANNFDNNPYVLMSPILTPGSGLAYTGPTDWTQDTYQALNISYNDINTGTLYNNFNTFSIKVCFYSDNPSIAPQIKNFRAIATA